jgi:hypothetical protein
VEAELEGVTPAEEADMLALRFEASLKLWIVAAAAGLRSIAIYSFVLKHMVQEWLGSLSLCRCAEHKHGLIEVRVRLKHNIIPVLCVDDSRLACHGQVQAGSVCPCPLLGRAQKAMVAKFFTLIYSG